MSCGKNLRLPFAVNVILKLSIKSNKYSSNSSCCPRRVVFLLFVMFLGSSLGISS